MKVTLDITTKDTKGMDELTTSFIKEIVEHELANEAAKILEDITNSLRSEDGFSYKISKAKCVNEEENRPLRKISPVYVKRHSNIEVTVRNTKDNSDTKDKLFVYGIFLDEENRKEYGMSNPQYTTVPGYLTVGSYIVRAVQTDNTSVALTGLLVDVDPAMWPSLDSLEAGYDRIKVRDVSGDIAYMYAAPKR